VAPILPSFQHQPGFNEIDPQSAAASLKAFRVVDVREPGEFVGPLGHIEEAQSIPLTHLPAVVEGWPPTESLLVVCRSGARSARACEYLKLRGFGAVYNLRGGMLGWEAAGLPVVRQAGPAAVRGAGYGSTVG
jgi:rhodanese-related sulfurtransferase